MSSVNLQHDCHLGGCQATGTKAVSQERETTAQTKAIVKHCDDTHFIMNIHSLHNSRSIMEALPPNLQHSTFTVDDEQALRKAAAEKVRSKKAEQSLAKQDLLLAQMLQISNASNQDQEGEKGSNDLLKSLDNDQDLAALVGNMFGGEQPDDETAAASGAQPSTSTQSVRITQ